MEPHRERSTKEVMADLIFNPQDLSDVLSPDPTVPVLPTLLSSWSPHPSDVFETASSETSSNSTMGFFNATDERYNMATELWFRHSLDITAIYCLAYSIVFVLGICGNSFVVAVVLRSPRMKTVTNYFIMNLALADILVLLFCLPATLVSNIFIPWVLGSFTCKSVSYLQGVSVSASINTLVAVSVDRFFAICYPLRCQLSTRSARRIIMMIWIFSFLITLPWAIYFQLVPMDASHPDLCFCTEIWPHEDFETLYFLSANLGLCYILPLVIITACYTGIWLKVARRHIPGETKGTNAEAVIQRSKLKVVKMLVVVVVMFVMSWLPLYIIFTRIKIGGPVEEGSTEESVLMIMAPVAQWLGASNSCINPLLYAFFNKKFRKGFLAIVKSRKCCGTLRYDMSNKRTKSTVLRSTFKSRLDTQCEFVSSAEV